MFVDGELRARPAVDRELARSAYDLERAGGRAFCEDEGDVPRRDHVLETDWLDAQGDGRRAFVENGQDETVFGQSSLARRR